MFFIATPKGAHTRTEITAENVISFYTRVCNKQLELDSILITTLDPIHGEKAIIGYCRIDRKDIPVIELPVYLDQGFRWYGVQVTPLEIFEGGLTYKHNTIFRTTVWNGAGIGKVAYCYIDNGIAISLIVG